MPTSDTKFAELQISTLAGVRLLSSLTQKQLADRSGLRHGQVALIEERLQNVPFKKLAQYVEGLRLGASLTLVVSTPAAGPRVVFRSGSSTLLPSGTSAAPGGAPVAHPAGVLQEAIRRTERPTPDVARDLGISRYQLASILAERKNITPDVAARLGRYFGTGARYWSNLQLDYDEWLCSQKLDLSHIPQST